MPERTATAPVPKTVAPSTVAPAELQRGLSIGLTESNAALVHAPQDGSPVRAWQQRIADLRPQLFRIPVDWAGLQPDPSQPARLDQPADGCMRGIKPCAPYGGVRDLLRSLHSQESGGGFQGVVVLYGVPEWAAAPAGGCERPGIQPRSRPLNERGLAAYRALVRQIADVARAEHVDLRWWSPWNEPNGAFFISPQRAQCSRQSPSLAAKVYTRLYTAMKSELDALPGDQRMVLGDLAGVAKGTSRATGSGELVRALPDSVVCSASVVAQHAYADLPGQKKQPGDPIAATRDALRARPCSRDTPMWITETGVGGVHAGDERKTDPAALHRQCVAFDDQLAAWSKDPRIQAAFQYSFREDPAFPVGLADAGLTRTYPTYDLLKAWARRGNPADPPPALPASCR